MHGIKINRWALLFTSLLLSSKSSTRYLSDTNRFDVSSKGPSGRELVCVCVWGGGGVGESTRVLHWPRIEVFYSFWLSIYTIKCTECSIECSVLVKENEENVKENEERYFDVYCQHRLQILCSTNIRLL